MANVAHANLTGANLHEPKGVSTASSGQVYVANGSGSGVWSAQSVDGETGVVATGENKGRILVTDGSNGAGWQTTVWKDMIGHPIYRSSGATAPSQNAFRVGGRCLDFAFASGDEIGYKFHINHDYKPGSDLYLHVHWGHNGTAISGNMVWTYYVTYAKGHNQANFPAEVTGTITYATVDVATTPQYRHRIDEIQLSASSPSASQIDTDDLEVDGLILVQIVASTIPTITGGTPNEPFLFQVDMHYQSSYIGTANKAPAFYA